MMTDDTNTDGTTLRITARFQRYHNINKAVFFNENYNRSVSEYLTTFPINIWISHDIFPVVSVSSKLLCFILFNILQSQLFSVTSLQTLGQEVGQSFSKWDNPKSVSGEAQRLEVKKKKNHCVKSPNQPPHWENQRKLQLKHFAQ